MEDAELGKENRSDSWSDLDGKRIPPKDGGGPLRDEEDPGEDACLFEDIEKDEGGGKKGKIGGNMEDVKGMLEERCEGNCIPFPLLFP